MYDLKIVGGTVVDGTGAPARRADVAIKDGKIVAVGTVGDKALRTIDAEGLLITPGFIDLHTHYDGQISWDETLAPSCFHGVTSTVLGNCGVGFAPVRPEDREKLIALMEGVEDIPGTALSEGIEWRWESFSQYMDAIDAMPHTMDYAMQLPHDALRVYVMGQRGLAREEATEADIAEMRRLTREALEAGAMGFSTGRTDNHLDADGGHTPASISAEAELCGIAEAFRGLEHGVLQAVSDFDMVEDRKRFDAEFDLLIKMGEASGGHPLSISLLQRVRDTNQWKWIVGGVEAAAARGLEVKLQVGARGIGVLLGLQATFHPFMGFPSYKKIAKLPLAERVQVMRDPAFKAQMMTEKSDKVSGEGTPIPPLADEFLAHMDFLSGRVFRMGSNFNYEPEPSESILAEAMRLGQSPLSLVYDVMLEDEGAELLYFPIYNYHEQNLDAVHTMLTHPLALPGLSDGGAHVGTVCDASFPTFMLTHWTRDRTRGPKLPLERVVQMMTADNARHLRIKDRGAVAPGLRADLNIIDYDHLKLERPRMVKDLPAGGQRLLQDARGYRFTIIHGQIVIEDDKLTEARPGRLMRMGR